MQSEVTIILKGEDNTFKKKFNNYEPIKLDGECPILQSLIDEAKSAYKANPEEILVKVTLRIE